MSYKTVEGELENGPPALLRENAVYQGVRVTMQARLGRARIPLQVDIGFGDVVTPHSVKTIFPMT